MRKRNEVWAGYLKLSSMVQNMSQDYVSVCVVSVYEEKEFVTKMDSVIIFFALDDYKLGPDWEAGHI